MHPKTTIDRVTFEGMKIERIHHFILRGVPPEENAPQSELRRWRYHVAVRTLALLPPLWLILVLAGVSTWMLVVFGVVTIMSIANVIALRMRTKRP